jgi:hypothetical protein
MASKPLKSKFLTVKYFCQVHGIKQDYPARLSKGLECWKESKARGYEIKESWNAQGLKVNKYHIDILRLVFLASWKVPE